MQVSPTRPGYAWRRSWGSSARRKSVRASLGLADATNLHRQHFPCSARSHCVANNERKRTSKPCREQLHDASGESFSRAFGTGEDSALHAATLRNVSDRATLTQSVGSTRDDVSLSFHTQSLTSNFSPFRWCENSYKLQDDAVHQVSTLLDLISTLSMCGAVTFRECSECAGGIDL